MKAVIRSYASKKVHFPSSLETCNEEFDIVEDVILPDGTIIPNTTTTTTAGFSATAAAAENNEIQQRQHNTGEQRFRRIKAFSQESYGSFDTLMNQDPFMMPR